MANSMWIGPSLSQLFGRVRAMMPHQYGRLFCRTDRAVSQLSAANRRSIRDVHNLMSSEVGINEFVDIPKTYVLKAN